MRATEFEARISEGLDVGPPDNTYQLSVVRAWGLWPGLHTLGSFGQQTLGREQIYRPFLALLSTPEPRPEDRRYGVVMADSEIDDPRPPGRPPLFIATIAAKSCLETNGDMHVTVAPDEAEDPNAAYFPSMFQHIEGDLGTLVVRNSEPTLAPKMALAHERGANDVAIFNTDEGIVFRR